MPSVISGDANVSATEFGYLDGVTSGLQSQIDGKANDSAVGLVKIVDSIFTSQASVAIDNCFTSTYTNYLVLGVFSGSDAGTSRSVTLNMRASGSNDTSSNYEFQSLTADNTTVLSARSTSQTSWVITSVRTATIGRSFTFFAPQRAERTHMEVSSNGYTTALFMNPVTAVHTAATQFDGFSLSIASGTLTGSLRVYGYRD